MGKIATYAVLTTLVAVATVSYGSELSQGLQKKFQDNPEQGCKLIQPISKAINVLTVPIGAQHRKEVVWRETAPEGFHAVLALMQVVSVAPCTLEKEQEAKLSIRAIRLIERHPTTGTEEVVAEVNDFSRPEKTTLIGKLFQRIPRWYPPHGNVSDPMEGMISLDDKVLMIDLSKTPRLIYHGWTEPQVEAKPGMNYLVEMEVKISGAARLQMGVDYWREIGASDIGWDGTCQKTNHCEGYLSRWFGPIDGFQTIRTPDTLRR